MKTNVFIEGALPNQGSDKAERRKVPPLSKLFLLSGYEKPRTCRGFS